MLPATPLPAANASLSAPQRVTLDSQGSLYFSSGDCVYKVDSARVLTRVAGSAHSGYSGDGGPATRAALNGPQSLAVDGAGNLYIADAANNRIRRVTADGVIATVAGNGRRGYSGDGGPATSAELAYPIGLAADAAGNLYIADTWNLRIRKVAATCGVITSIAGNGSPGYSGDGGASTDAQFSGPSGVALDAAGNLYVADGQSHTIRKVAVNGTITTVAGNGTAGWTGDGGPAANAQLNRPFSVAVDGAGAIYLADPDNNIVRKIDANGTITTVAGSGRYSYSGDGGPATSAQLYSPTSVAADAAGNFFYIADSLNNVIRKVTAGGTISTYAGHHSAGYLGDGGPATSAQINVAYGVAVDAVGNVYIADSWNNVIRKVATNGVISTVAGTGTGGYSGDGGPATNARLARPYGVAADATGTIYIADSGSYTIRKVAPDGTITTIAGRGGGEAYTGDGGLATKADLSGPKGVAVDTAGNVYVADTGNNAIRLLVPQGSRAVLSITQALPASFARRQAGASITVDVANASGAGSTGGAVTVTEIVPSGLTLISMSGSGWACSDATCTRSDTLAAGSSYPTITLTVNVAPDAPSQVTNKVSVLGGGSPAASTSEVANIAIVPQGPVLTWPGNGAVGVVVAPALSWLPSAAAISYDIYFGTSAAPPMVTNTTSTSYAVGTLAAGTTYYWQIVARNGSGTSGSGVRSFTTTGTAATGLRFVAASPCRVADTRGGPIMEADSSRSFAIPQSACGIPSTALAYSLNVTVVPSGPLPYLTLWPTGQTRPGVSTLNSFSGIVVANAAIVPAGTGGAVSVYVTSQTHVILDINSYFDTSTGPTSYAFYPTTPCRVVDTRYPIGTFGGPTMAGQTPRDFPLPMSACAPPATARAYSLNVTVVPDLTKHYLGYLTTWPTGQSQPGVSTLNSWTGKVVANAAIVPAGTNESVSVFVSDPTEVILDTNGYFAAPGRAGALTFYSVTPCRIADTRGAEGPFGGPGMEAQETRSFAIPASQCNIPATAAAYSLNVTVVPGGVLPYLTAWPMGVARPNVSTLNSFDGTVVANATIVPAGTDGAIGVFVTNKTDVILDINGYFAP